MAIVLRLGDVVELNYIRKEKTIVLTTKTIIYEIMVNSEGVALALVDLLQKSMIKESPVRPEPKLPRFYIEGEGQKE